jgi:hypothetical protein
MGHCIGFWSPAKSKHMLMKFEANFTEISEAVPMCPAYQVQYLAKDNIWMYLMFFMYFCFSWDITSSIDHIMLRDCCLLCI